MNGRILPVPSRLWLRPLCVVLLLAVAAVGCGGGADSAAVSRAPAEVISVSGSGTGLPIVERLANAYMEIRPGVSFQFNQGTNSGGAITGAAEGTIDLGVVNRALTKDEAMIGVEMQPFAVDSMVFAVRQPSAVTALSTNQVRALFGGSITNWAELGGISQPVVLLGRDPDETATKSFFVPVMGGTKVAATIAILTNSADMIDALTTAPGGIGYTTLGLLNLNGDTSLTPVAIDGLAPSAAAVENGSYKWTMALGLVSSRGQAAPAVAGFLEFVRSAAGSKIIRDLGYADPT